MAFLLYPATDDQSFYFYNKQDDLVKAQTIASSSLAESPFAYEHYEKLPNVFEGDFTTKLRDLAEKNNITAIYTTNEYVANECRKQGIPLPIIKVGEGIISLSNRYRSFEEKAAAFLYDFEKKHQYQPLATQQDITRMLYGVSQYFGESHAEKLFHFIHCFEYTVQQKNMNALQGGLIVEAGSLMGKQAIALGLLCDLYKCHGMAVVDPWCIDTGKQDDAPAFLNDISATLDVDAIKNVCISNLRNNRFTSVQVYQNTIENQIEHFETISFIHLDGNHDYENVKTQLELIYPKVISGGCILCDDYIWPLSDSVKRAVDEFIQQHNNLIAKTEVMDENMAIFFR